MRHEQFNVPTWFRRNLSPGRYELEGSDVTLTVSGTSVLRGLRRAFPDLRAGQIIMLERTPTGLRAELVEEDESSEK